MKYIAHFPLMCQIDRNQNVQFISLMTKYTKWTMKSGMLWGMHKQIENIDRQQTEADGDSYESYEIEKNVFVSATDALFEK